jgi:hypothetical protein
VFYEAVRAMAYPCSPPFFSSVPEPAKGLPGEGMGKVDLSAIVPS